MTEARGFFGAEARTERALAVLQEYATGTFDLLAEHWIKGDLLGVVAFLPRNQAPLCFSDLNRNYCLSTSDLRTVICDLWNGAEWPCRALRRADWLKWFRSVGFVTDSGRTPPVEPVEVWRSQAGRTIGLAWTTDREQAEWFHERNVGRLGYPARMLHGFAPPSAVLALIDERSEAEAVCDPTGERFWKVVPR